MCKNSMIHKNVLGERESERKVEAVLGGVEVRAWRKQGGEENQDKKGLQRTYK